jgi:putative DNA primase/helicase
LPQQEQSPQPKPEPEAETYEALPRPCFRVYHEPWEHAGTRYPSGTWFHDRTVDKKTGAPVDWDYRLCAPLEILAKTSTRDIEHGRLVEFVTSNFSSKKHILPMRLFAGRGDEALGELLSLGLETVRRYHSDILVYIQESRPKERWAAALTTGWQHDDAFVLPDEIITPEGSDFKIWYGGRDSESPYRRAGSLQQWQDGVAAFAPGNPNLIVALCAAFAGPLLYKFGVPGALLHLFGPSSTGKTTTLAAAASVWGGGTADGKNAYVRSWQITGVGVEAIASLHSDTLAVLDELHLVEPRVLDPVIYAFSCG